MNSNYIITFVEHSFVDSLNKDSLVLDLGGYKGEFTDKIIEKYGCKVYIVEPDIELYNGLVEKYKENDSVSVFNLLMYGDSQMINFYPRRKNETSGSIFQNHPSVGDNPIQISAISLDEFVFRYVGERKIDLIKMDIEGAEINTIINSFKAFELCKQVSVEFHDFCNMGIEEDDVSLCIGKMRILGFEFVNRSKANKLKYFDCLFFRG